MTVEQAFQQALQHHQSGRFAAAATLYKQILAVQPQNPHALHLLGVAYFQMDRAPEAADLIKKSVALFPTSPEAFNNLGLALHAMQRDHDAIAAYRQSLTLRPGAAEVHYNFGLALAAAGQLDEAIAAYQQSLALRPQFPEAQHDLAGALTQSNRLDEALLALGQVPPAHPGRFATHSNLIFKMYFQPQYDGPAILRQHGHWAELYADPLAPEIRPHTNDRSPDRRLRIGYVGAYFRDHCISFFTLPLFAHHNHDQFEIFCYADDSLPDAVTDRHRTHVDTWRTIIGLPERQLAEMIRADRIDILVDLTMHMARGRQLVFARKPAPIQITWAAYPGTTGNRAIDYRFTDPQLDPPPSPSGSACHDADYSEASIRLPHTFWCYDPRTLEPAVNALPAATADHITFGCLNNFTKVNDDVIALWAKVMLAVPNSRLLILVPSESHPDRLLTKFASRGITPDRIEITPHRPRPEYLKLYHRIDICLDTFPYNGHTTSLDALWMGVPVITLCGQTCVSRAGLSQLTNLHLTDLVANTPEQFIHIATQLANDLPRLATLRATLRPRMQSSPLMNAPLFARNVESAYRTLWTKWCNSTP